MFALGRQLVAPTIAIGIVVAVAYGSVNGQTEEGAQSSAFTPAAVANADKVDGRHAVGFGATKKQRATKLVATNKSGLLPSNIVKPKWSLIQGMPAGFKDGKDNRGVTKFYVKEKTTTANAVVGSGDLNIRCDTGDFATGGSIYALPAGAFIAQSLPDYPASAGSAPIGWAGTYERVQSDVTATITVYAVCADAA